MSKTTFIILIIGIALTVAPILRIIYRKLGSDLHQSVESWTTYFRGPGMLQLVFLVIGGVGAGASVAYAPPLRTLSGEVKEYQIDPGKPALHQVSIENYSHLTILARASEPVGNAKARLMIFRSGVKSGSGETTQIEIASSLWTRLDLENSYPSMSLIAEPSTETNATQATRVEVMIYLRTQ